MGHPRKSRFARRFVHGQADIPKTRKHSGNVGIEDRHRQIPGKRLDGGRCIFAKARQGTQILGAPGKFSPIPGADKLCGLVEIAGPPVVAESLPEPKHLRFPGFGQCVDYWKSGHPIVVVGKDGGDGRLLEHDLGNSHRIGIGTPTPGQVASGPSEPSLEFFP